MSPRTAFEVQLPHGGPTVHLLVLTAHELIDAMKVAGGEGPLNVRGLAVSREALRRSVRNVDGRDVAYHDLLGEGWRKLFPRTRHTLQLAGTWEKLHAPTAAELDAFCASMSPSVEGDREVWTATLPDGRTIRMREQDEDTVEDILRDAAASDRGGSAQELRATIAAGRRCLVEPRGADLDSAAKWDAAFSVKDTVLIGRLWSEIHVGGMGEEPTVGEVPRAGGT